MNILVADSSEMVRKAIRVELENGGYDVLEAANGLETLIIAAREAPDLVTLEIEMPGLNGFETCRKLRGAHYSRFFRHKINGQMPIIFITGKDTIEGRKEGFQLGAADFIVKPFSQGQVLSAANNMLKRKKDLEGLTALAVDDSPVARCIISETLKREGATVLEAADGVQAFEKLCAGLSEIDMIITDMVMPRMNGLELCKKIRNELHLPGLPIIFLTAASDQAELIEIFNAGATDYLIKPFLREELLARLNAQFEKLQIRKNHRDADAELAKLQQISKRLSQICENAPRSSLGDILKAARSLSENAIDKKHDREEIDRIQKSISQIDAFLLEVSALIAPIPFEKIEDSVEQTAGPVTVLEPMERSARGETDVDVDVDLENSVVLDREELMGRVGGEKELFDEIIALFLQDAPLQMDKLEKAMEKRDKKTIAGQGHAIKGAAANIGAHALRDAAFEMEKAGKTDDWEVMDKAFRKVAGEFKLLKKFLSRS